MMAAATATATGDTVLARRIDPDEMELPELIAGLGQMAFGPDPVVLPDGRVLHKDRLRLVLHALLAVVAREAQVRPVLELAAGLLPPGGRVLDVGGGDGFLSRLFVRAGYCATLYDPIYGGPHPPPCNREGVDIVPRCFRASDATEGDLVIGYHPGGATPALASVRRRPVIIVPCCQWGYWLKGRWENRTHARVKIGPGRDNIAFVSEG